jgi:hypothetical protein
MVTCRLSSHFTIAYWKLIETEGKFLVGKCEFGLIFGLSLGGNCREFEFTVSLELLPTFGMSLEGVCNELDT